VVVECGAKVGLRMLGVLPWLAEPAVAVRVMLVLLMTVAVTLDMLLSLRV
jgi:hypothetical protein